MSAQRSSNAMEKYRRRTKAIVKSFLQHKRSFPECIAALDAALAEFVPRMKSSDLRDLRIEMLANNEVVMKEMDRRSHAASAN